MFAVRKAGALGGVTGLLRCDVINGSTFPSSHHHQASATVRYA